MKTKNSRQSNDEKRTVNRSLVEKALDAMLFMRQGERPDVAWGMNPLVEYVTSSDIVDMLSSTMTADIDTVAECMAKRGYSLVRMEDDRLAWAVYVTPPVDMLETQKEGDRP